jgi:hypothetical protein
MRQTIASLEPTFLTRFGVFRQSVEDAANSERFRTQFFLLFSSAALLVSLAVG